MPGSVRRGETVQEDERQRTIAPHLIVDRDTVSVVENSALYM